MHRLVQLAFTLAALLTLTLLPQPAQARSETQVYGAFGDAAGPSECPSGQQLVGFSGRWGLWIDRIQIVCATPLAGGHFSQPVALGPEFGGAGGVRKDGYCPPDTMMTDATLVLTNGDRQVASISLNCISRATGEPNYATFGNLGYQRTPCGKGGGIHDCPSSVNVVPYLACPSDEVPLGINVRYGQHVNALGLICGRLVAAAPQVRSYNPPPPPKVIHHTGKPKVPTAGLAPVSMFGGKWETVTDQNGHYELTLGTMGDGTAAGPGGVVSIPMNVSGIFTNTDGAHDYDGTIGGIVQPNTRQLIYTFTQKNGQSGSGTFILSTDGNSLTGEGVANGTHFTWNGQRAP